MAKESVSGRRPAWHKDAKWASGLLALVSLVLALALLSAFRLTAEQVTVPALSTFLAALVSPGGLDVEDEGLRKLRQRLSASASKRVRPIPELAITVSAREIRGKSPREIRTLVLSKLVRVVYRDGRAGLAALSGNRRTVEQISELPVGPFTSRGHGRLGRITIYLALPSLVLLAALVFFSGRLGRVVSPGLVLALAGLPALPLAGLAAQAEQLAASATVSRESESGQTTYALAQIVPDVAPVVRTVYLVPLLVGLSLLLVAAVARVALAIRSARRSGAVPVEGP